MCTARFAVFIDTDVYRDFEHYLRNMAKPTIWGDDLEIRALVLIYTFFASLPYWFMLYFALSPPQRIVY